MIGHLCNQDHCREYGCIELKKQARHLYTKPTLTPLEQFNEEVMKEIPDHIICGHCNVKITMKDFITQKLTEHKELILGMVREKIFEDTNYDYKLWIESEKYRWHQGGRKELREEFLNNLDTI